MARDSSLHVRRAVISRLKADAAVSAIVGDRVFAVASAEPTWPFVRYGVAVALPRRASCLDGARLSLSLHAFAKDSDDVDGLDQVQELAAAIASALDGASVDLADAPYDARLYDIAWLTTQTIEDSEEASAFHAIVQLEASVSS